MKQHSSEVAGEPFEDPGADAARLPAAIVSVHGAAAWVLLAAATIYALHEAAAVFVPTLVSVLLAYALEPFVAALTRVRVPRLLAAGIVYVILVMAVVALGRSLGDQIAFLDQLPEMVATVQQSLEGRDRSDGSLLERVQRAAADGARAGSAASAPPPSGVQRVAVVKRPLELRGYLLNAGMNLLTTGAAVFVVALLTFLLLATGDLFKRKLVKIAGPRFAEKKITLEVIHTIERQIERYLLVRLWICGIVAVATGIALRLLGVAHPAVLGLIAGVLNVLPFIGPTTGVVLAAVAAFFQFKTIEMAGAAGGAAAIVAALEGNLVTPWLTSRAGELNTVAVVISVVFWGWMWGIWGLLLAVPIMIAVKAAADHIGGLQPVGELLGR